MSIRALHLLLLGTTLCQHSGVSWRRDWSSARGCSISGGTRPSSRNRLLAGTTGLRQSGSATEREEAVAVSDDKPMSTHKQAYSRESLLAFANSLSTTTDFLHWLGAYRQGLMTIIPAVDRISININRGVNISTDEFSRDAVAGTHIIGEGAIPQGLLIGVGSDRDESYFVALSRRAGFPVDDYQPAVPANFYSDSGLYLGSIVFWNKTSSAPIPPSVIAQIEEMRPFLTFLFTSAFLRFASANRLYTNAVRCINRLSAVYQLSRREREVLICRFNGKSVAESAKLLNISVPTVRRHLRSLAARICAREGSPQRVLGFPFQFIDAIAER
jgi:DNA-binding CsgD family transcriptional regulator